MRGAPGDDGGGLTGADAGLPVRGPGLRRGPMAVTTRWTSWGGAQTGRGDGRPYVSLSNMDEQFAEWLIHKVEGKYPSEREYYLRRD